jgi:CrcB protein
VALGSAVGGVARFAIGTWLQRRLDDWAPHAGPLPFPIGTLVVNASGSFLLGIILVVVARQGEHASATRLLLAVGLCGGYTTFSTFSSDTVALIESGGSGLAMVNVIASVGLALLATLAGATLARVLFARPL